MKMSRNLGLNALAFGLLVVGALACDNTVEGVKKDTQEAKGKAEDTAKAAEAKLEALKDKGTDKLKAAKKDLNQGVSDLGKKIGGTLRAAGKEVEKASE